MTMGKRSFTDFDAVMEWRNLGWLVFEVKCAGKDVPTGQRIALERFVGDTKANGKWSMVAIVEHGVTNPREDIFLRDCLVRSVYTSDELVWRPPKRWMNARELMRLFIAYIDSMTGGGPSGPPPFG